MSEVKPGFARDWVEFADPNDDLEIFKCDLMTKLVQRNLAASFALRI